MQVRLLGRVEVDDDQGDPVVIRQRKLRESLAVIVLANGPLSSGELQAALWGDTGNALSALTTTMNRLRKLLPDGRLVRDQHGYRLDLDPERDYLDVQEFRELVATAHKVREAYPSRSAELLRQAVDLWRDPQLPDLFDTQVIADLLRVERHDAIEALVEVQLALGQHSAVAREAPGWLAEDQLNDQLWRALMLAHYRDGHKGAALMAFDDARAVFLTELGAEASPPLQAIRSQIAANAPGLAWTVEQTVQESRAILAGADVTVASPARFYDYLLGGNNNFEVDRTAADALIAAAPDLRDGAYDSRRFLHRAVRLLAERGIRQFLDIGVGLPTRGSVHEVACDVDPDTRVVYVDIDAMVVAHGRAVIEDSRNTVYITGDLIKPAQIFADPQTRRLIDPTEPIGVLMLNVLHFIPADAAHQALEAYRARMAPGSALVISHNCRDGSDPEAIRTLDAVAARSATRIFQRSRAEIEAMFTGLELLAPLDTNANWNTTERTPERRMRLLGGVGILTATPPHSP
jgi:DNA-binding SARP family transcriptional activator/O-methyltransferase involved in polyketide biosynthesis